ncbi:MAG TPA: M28 family peptidase [Acidimicrobiia bacterium]|nr:M28 family peptidase [Acidimicrobiia bacterium]
MTPADLRLRLSAHLDTLVERIGPRPPGSPANRQATDYVTSVLTGAGLLVEATPFTTSWWEPGTGRLELADGSSLEVGPNPYSPPGTVSGDIVRLDAWSELDADRPSLQGRVLVLGPALAGEPVMPKAFPFFSSEEHQHLIGFLEQQGPAAVIAVSDRHASLPTFEDPDLDFPSITIAPGTAARLEPGHQVRLTLSGRTRRGQGVNVSAHAEGPSPRIVLSAHVDAKATTPGAFDNAASVATLLALAESGLDLHGATDFVFFNGEDHYDACGEQAWLASTDLGLVDLNINLDGAGVAGRRTAVTGFGCPPALEEQLERIAGQPGWTRMPPWWESDHAIFAMQGIPAVAITSEGVHDLFTSVAHTANDTLKTIDIGILAGIVEVLGSMLVEFRPTLAVRAGT